VSTGVNRQSPKFYIIENVTGKGNLVEGTGVGKVLIYWIFQCQYTDLHVFFLFFLLNMAAISWVADSPLWRMFSRFVFALVGPASSSSNTVASTADHSDQPGKIPWNTPPWLGIDPGPRGGQTVSYPTELSWLTVSLYHCIFMYHSQIPDTPRRRSNSIPVMQCMIDLQDVA